MTLVRGAVAGIALSVGLWLAAPAAADVIHLTSGVAIEVAAWRDAGDAVEFVRWGGIVRIAKTDIARIDGRTIRQDLRMYSAPASAAAPARGLDRPAAVKQMLDLLGQGGGLFGQTVLSAAEKARAFRKLREGWDGLEVPEALRDLHGKGQQAIQVATEAFVAEDEDVLPNVKERVEAARKGVEEVRAAVEKAAKEG